MKKAFETISLIPYLESASGGFRLELALDDARTLEGCEFPFRLVHAPGPQSRLVRAAVGTDLGSAIKQLFLLVQNHDVSPRGDGLTQVTNTTMDTLWQQTWTAYLDDPKESHGFIPFPAKGDASREKRLPCFKPLFFCKERGIFFHPPCPECGSELTLCRNDEQLKQAALAMFSTSMERHLYCPGCLAAKETATFYKWSRQPDDAVFVKDRVDLIVDFKRLRTPGDPQCGFPCTTCPNHSECYILDQKAKERVAFFSFYPFYMLVFEACALNAVDFLALAAGAPEKEINTLLHQGRKKVDLPFPCQFFFENDQRLFLEVLFVKLSFLHQVLEILATRADRAIWPGTGFSVQSLWIEPMKGTTPLPWLWNFRITLIDLLEIEPGRSGSREFSVHAFFRFFSSLWFYTLAVNKTQTFENVLRTLDTPGDSPGEIPLSMENLFWDPDRFKPPGEYQRFWTDALHLGLGMGTIPRDASLNREIALLAEQINTLGQEIKESLFSSTKNRPMETREKNAAPGSTNNPALARILTAILQRWQTEQADQMEAMEDDDVLETVVLSAPKEEQGLDKTVVIPVPKEEQELDKTVIISPDSRPSQEEDLEKTMIMEIPKPAVPVDPGTTIFDEKGFDDMEKTVILTPGKQKKENRP